MHGSGAVSCSLLIRGPNLPAVRQKLHLFALCRFPKPALCEDLVQPRAEQISRSCRLVASSVASPPPMRRPNHASRFEGIAKTNLQASRASDTETLQSQVNKAAEKRLSLSGLEILHGRLGRQYTDRCCDEAHEAESEEQHRLATKLVTVVADENSPDWPSNKSHCKGCESQQGPGKRIGTRKKKLVKNQTGSTAVEEKIVGLQGGTEKAAEQGLTR